MKAKHKLVYSLIPLMGIIVLLALWVYKTTKPFDTVAYVIFGLTFLVLSFSLYFIINKYNSDKAGLNPEDELSKRVKEKAAAKAFTSSIYMWTFVVLFLMDMNPREKIIVGLGIIGMGLIFFFNWFYFSKIGISSEDKD